MRLNAEQTETLTCPTFLIFLLRENTLHVRMVQFDPAVTAPLRGQKALSSIEGH